MATDVEICNLALARIRVLKTISALDTSTTESTVCTQFYAHCRDTTLEAFDWPFASRRALLTEVEDDAWAVGTTYARGDIVEHDDSLYISLTSSNLGNEPPDSDNWAAFERDWGFRYSLPADCLVPRAIDNGQLRSQRAEQKTPFRIEANDAKDGKLLLCDVEDAYLAYTAAVTDTDLFTPSFVDALVWLLAAELSLALAGKEALEHQMRSRWVVALSLAQGRSEQHEQADPVPDSEFVAVRR